MKTKPKKKNKYPVSLIEVWYDGACEPVNPGGHGGGGYIIKRNGYEMHRGMIYLPAGPEISNNVAEYSGIREALKWMIETKHTNHAVLVRGDNMMSVMQMAGKWKAKRGRYIPLYLECRELAKNFRNITFMWIPREKNGEADEISKKALKDHNVEFRIQPEAVES